jgi:predicted nucleotidyltransferase
MNTSARKEKRKAVAGGTARWWNLPRGWAHQSFFYLDRTQRIGRVIFEIVPTMLLAWLIGAIGGIGLSNLGLWCGSLLTVHTLNWVLNGNWWAGVLFTFPHLRNRGDRATCDYLNQMAGRLKRDRSISGAMVFGSVSRGQWHERSDLDIRLLRRAGVFPAIEGILILLRERWIAFVSRQPLDIYLADGIAFLKRMRPDEPPVFLKKDDLRLDLAYPGGKETRIETLRMNQPSAAREGVPVSQASSPRLEGGTPSTRWMSSDRGEAPREI